MPTSGATPRVFSGQKAPSPPAPRWAIVLACGLIAAAALAAYHNSFSTPFVFDDGPAVVDNRTIRNLWAIGDVLAASTPTGTGVRSRPMVNLSLAINYAVGGLNVRGYHVFNLAIHVLAGLTLFGLVRRTLAGPVGAQACCAAGVGRSLAIDDRPQAGFLQSDATLLAFTIALLWTLHPLQTESVVSAVQRTESLMALFYLLTLYLFIRGAESAKPRPWFIAAVTACLAGMASKEVMVSAPLMVLLYDRTFVTGSFREAWRRHRRLYLGLACTWGLLGVLMVTSGGQRGGTVGFDLGVSSWDYALTQCRAIILYLKLSLWPHPLVADYGTALVKRPTDVLPQALSLVLLVTGTVLALRRRPALGLAGAWFFAVLAPSSSILPLTSQTMAEHRMYLSLAAVVAVAVFGGYLLAGRRSTVAFLVLAAGLGGLTVSRNEVYRSDQSFWSDVVARRPDNPRAHYNLGILLDRASRPTEATEQYEAALRLKPDYADAHNNFGSLLYKTGRLAEAIAHYQHALDINPAFAEAYYNLGLALFNSHRVPEAVDQFEQALQLKPDYTSARTNLGIAFIKTGQVEAAITQFEQVLGVTPEDAEAHFNLANALAQAGRLPEAVLHFQTTLRLKPDFAEAYNSFGIALAEADRLPEAISQFEHAIRLQPDNTDARANLGIALVKSGRAEEAVRQLEQVVQMIPDDATAHYNLAGALVRVNALPEAASHYQAALRLKPDFTQARENLLQLQTSLGATK
jgi:tetratricopeptide (TPR) repeat protein